MPKTYCYRCSHPVQVRSRIYHCPTCGFRAYVYRVSLQPLDFALDGIELDVALPNSPPIRWYGGRPHALEKVERGSP